MPQPTGQGGAGVPITTYGLALRSITYLPSRDGSPGVEPPGLQRDRVYLTFNNQPIWNEAATTLRPYETVWIRNVSPIAFTGAASLDFYETSSHSGTPGGFFHAVRQISPSQEPSGAFSLTCGAYDINVDVVHRDASGNWI
ncbi:conserved protein of unknown function [Rhodovastum atsumiense]|uniref:Uncharacterized protein n=1 Tax=Rhodovastum atsumiense TaxID=504468 RepID=A0A5M6IID9_9PROT|nr:hypothetical protein [Rhodovastum atsumiense]KAA5607974.1 hypothetical protein F1189_31305 [Rhodovastum atsumiense]CAH2599056.1 conserved protein of unknown function [Rhodovastum atsumiense]